MRSFLFLASVACFLAPSARAQSVVWSDSFENGFAQWASVIDGSCAAFSVGGGACVGAWQPLDAAHPCSAWAAPFPDGGQVAWFGIAGTCTYDGGSETGSNHALRLTAPIQLPSGASLALRFLSKSEGESDTAYDTRSVHISHNGGSSWTTLGQVWNSDWFEASFDVTPWSGQSVLLKFKFNTWDDSQNAYHGWYLDALRIESAPGAGTSYCAGDGTASDCPCGNFGASGRGCATSFDAAGASLTATGSAQVSADSIVLGASGVSNSVVTFFQGTTQQAFGLGATFGDGLRCAGGTVLRLAAVQASANAAVHPQAGGIPVSVKGAIPAGGGVRTYQVWYRNAAAFCTPSTFNLSNGLILSWTP